MRMLKGGNAFRGCDQTDKDKAVTAFFLHTISSHDGRSAGRQRRVSNDNLPLIDVRWQFFIVLDRPVRFRVTLHAQMTNGRFWQDC